MVKEQTAVNLKTSRTWLARAEKVIPSSTQTFSKGPTQWAREISPHYLVRGDGAWVWDADENKYLDYLMALGPIILGYNNKRVNEAIMRQLAAGTVFSQMHPLEVEVAELLVDIIPCAEMVRFSKNGSDATSGAVRAARAYTGRDLIMCCGYHGWHDWHIGTTTRDAGVPKAVGELTHTFEYNNLASLKGLFDAFDGKIAAVIMEPVGVEKPKDGFLAGVKDLCHKNGALLIFDEIVTGFRLGLGGAQELFGVTPDMACLGKAMANGMPLSAIVGRRNVMDIFDEIFFSGTFGGETLSLAACQATINELRDNDVFAHIWRINGQLLSGLNEIISEQGLECVLKSVGYGARSTLNFVHENEYQSRLYRSYFMQECVKRGLLYYGVHMPCHAHGDIELEFTLNVFREIVPLFAAAYEADDFADRLEGPPVEPIFRKP